MANNLTLEEFLILWSQATGKNATPRIARNYLEGLHKLLLQELKLNGEMTIYGIGKFVLRENGGRDSMMGDPINGGIIRRYINTRVNVNFKQSAILKREVNELGFEKEKPIVNRARKYNSRAEKREAYNAPRRKPVKSVEEMAIDALNDAVKKKEKLKNGKTQI